MKKCAVRNCKKEIFFKNRKISWCLPDEFWLILQGEDWELDILEYGYSSGEESVSDSDDADDVFDVKLSLSHSAGWTFNKGSASVEQKQEGMRQRKNKSHTNTICTKLFIFL